MTKKTDDFLADEENREQWDRLLFALKGRDRPTLALIAFDSDRIRGDIYEKLTKDLCQYQFYELNLTDQRVVSLVRAFEENLPGFVLRSQPAEYIVNASGLENSLFTMKEGRLEESAMISELNFEREILFRHFPFIIILWADIYMVGELRKKAKDLWDWITYYFEFRGEEDDAVKPENRSGSSCISKTHEPERMRLIRNMQDKYERLKPDDFSTERIVREKLTIQKLMGREYMEMNDCENAIQSFSTALTLAGHINASEYDSAEISFLMGVAYSKIGEYGSALESCQLSLELREEKAYSGIGNVCHVIGRVFEKQGRWNDALKSYQRASEWHKKEKNDDEMGNTYYRIGKVFDAQRKRGNALANYKRALSCYQKEENDESIRKIWLQMTGSDGGK